MKSAHQSFGLPVQIVIVLSLCLTFFAHSASAQGGEYKFTKALSALIPAHYGREALYSDLLAYKVYTDSLSAPKAGGIFGKNESGQDILWQEITADSLGRLRPPGRGGGFFGPRGLTGYLYLTYTADKPAAALLNIKGNSGVYINGSVHAGDPYSSGWLYIPCMLKKGLNEFYVRGQFVTASLIFPKSPIEINVEDPTVPSIIPGQQTGTLRAAVTVINDSPKPLSNARLKATVEGKEMETELPQIPPLSTRKIAFDLNASSVTKPGKINCALTLVEKGKDISQASITLDAVTPADKYTVTFTSDIDGSLQYYAVAPQTGGNKPGSALFLSVHGAGVEAIGQARAYHSKDWGTLVAATNRRPRGFNWEDWGRLDALEVLALARKKFDPDPQHIYLTGHSMGGHGTWFLGATYPDKWAAIGACSGYPTLKGYGSADGIIPDSSSSPMEQMLIRTSNQSDVIKLATNYKPLGVYVLHGDADATVSVNYARQMRKVLADFHTDMSYHEVPGAGHWFGDESVDWKPLFDFFKWHTLPVDTAVNNIDFITANPGISSRYFWASIEQQVHPLAYSRVQLRRNKNQNNISGTTENVKKLSLALDNFKMGNTIKISLDNVPLEVQHSRQADTVFLEKQGTAWVSSKADVLDKNPRRYGTLKDAFNHRMVFVYSTAGTKDENDWSREKATFDAETWYYRGNGAVDIIPDKEYVLEKYKDRGVIIFGNATTNLAYKKLLADCPLKMERNKVSAGDLSWTGPDLAGYFMWPLAGSATASVAVIGGSGIGGMKAANANQYFAGASGFPDFMIFSLDMLKSGTNGVKFTGFYDNNWRLSPQDFVDKR